MSAEIRLNSLGRDWDGAVACWCCYVGIRAGLGSLYLSWGHKLRFWRSQTSLYICKDAEWEVIVCRCLSVCPHFIWTEEIKHSLASAWRCDSGPGGREERGKRRGWGGNISQEIIRQCLQWCVILPPPNTPWMVIWAKGPKDSWLENKKLRPNISSSLDLPLINILGSLAGVSRPWWYLWPRRIRRAEGRHAVRAGGARCFPSSHVTSLGCIIRPGVVTGWHGRLATLSA